MVQRYGLTSEDVWWCPLPLCHMSGVLPLAATLLADSRVRVHGRLRAGGRAPPDRAGAGDVPLRHLPDGEPGARRPSRPGGHRPELGPADEHPGHDAPAGGAPRRAPERDPPPRLRLHASSAGSCRSRTPRCRATSSRRPRARHGLGCRSGSSTPSPATTSPPERAARSSRGAGACSRATSPAPGRRRRPSTSRRLVPYGRLGQPRRARPDQFHGRLKDMLKIGGENVAAARDRVVPRGPSCGRRRPGRGRARRPPGGGGRRLRPARARRRGTEAELIEFCRGRIASYKIPRYVRFVDEWPMSATKIQKTRLREQLLAELEAAGI